MRLILKACCCLVVLTGIAFAQSDRSTITGTISDPTGAVVAGSTIQAKNSATGAHYQTVSTATGNYTLAQIPFGTYEITVTMQGFKTYLRQGINVPTAQTLRIDVTLEVGAITESVTVNADAPLLKTDSTEVSHNVSVDQLNTLPVLSIGAGVGLSGVRNPFSVLQLLPGADWRPDSSVRVNGTPGNTQSFRVEGQDSTNNLYQSWTQYVQPSVDAIQEFSVQTSNYAAEYGQAGSAVFNLTMRSGTNAIHGGAYDYFVNEALNAGQAFTEDPAKPGNHIRNRQRRNDFGFNLGGPVYIPKVIDGRDKLFFFFNFEEYRETQVFNTFRTVPTQAMRNGDFSALLTGRNICPASTPNCDKQGRPVFENTIYDPSTDQVINGVRYRQPFANNKIDPSRFDPVSAKLLAMIPTPNGPNANLATNNFLASYARPLLTYIPAVKIDYSLSSKAKLSGYYSRNKNYNPNTDGFPAPITSGIPRQIISHTVRLNFDYTLRPTMLLHLGAGLVKTTDSILNDLVAYDVPGKLGIPGTNAPNIMPYFQLLSNGYGGLSGTMGANSAATYLNYKPTANASLTWVKGSHTYKFGAETIVESQGGQIQTFANGWFSFNANDVSDPQLQGLSLPGGAVGHPFASFLLGRVNGGTTNAASHGHLGSHSVSFFAQDTWKITRKLTFDYGLRYDYQTYLKEQYGRWANFSPTAANPSAGGLAGAVIYEGYGPNRCNCQFAKIYPFAFGPRIGLAYQFAPKTVLRVGAGISYGKTSELGLINNTVSVFSGYAAPGYGDPATTLSKGQPYPWTWPQFNPGLFPCPSPPCTTLASPTVVIDPHAGRPARILQWSIGIQRELTKDLIVEANYVGNRGVWWYSTNITQWNGLTVQNLAAHGLDINNAADRTLLTTPYNLLSAANKARFPLPYAGWPQTYTLAQAIRPYPQFLGLNAIWIPTGNTWYDSLQAKLTKRFSHGFDFTYNFTWSKELALGAETSYWYFSPVQVNDEMNRGVNKYLSTYSRPLRSVIAGTYTTPRVLENIKPLSAFLRNWQFSAMLNYSSGSPIRVPNSSNQINNQLLRNSATPMTRVPGQPLLTVDLNCHCFDPNTTFVLNKNAWQEVPAGQFGTSAAYFNDFRNARHPTENMSLARNFRFARDGRITLQVRAEFTNIFNRAYIGAPTATNPLGNQQTSSTGQTLSGFGYINTQTGAQPRSGTIVMRLTF
jgi:hypothetical protein